MTARETTEPGVAPNHNGEADRRTLDVSRFGGGVSSDSQHAALRASVRQLGQLLGEALTRHEGPELLALVEEVRARLRASTEDDELHAELGASTTPPPSCWPAPSRRTSSSSTSPSSCTAGRSSTAGRGGPAGRHRPPDRRGARGGHHRPRARSTDVLARLEYRPVFTAHPTEASRRYRAATCSARSPTWCPTPRRTRGVRQARPRSARAPARRAGRPALADRRAADRATRADGRGPDRDLLPAARSPRRSSPTCSRSSTGQLATIDVELPPRRATAPLRHLGRRRPRRQPQRHAGR